ncbi:MAG: SBBP repeat-containing protein [Verrucomicrobiales bacterium]
MLTLRSFIVLFATLHSIQLHARPETSAEVAGWGYNGSGQLTFPPGLENVAVISVGHSHNLALRRDGIVIGWGNNDHGQSTVPGALSNVVAISAGNSHSVAMRSNGKVVAWGNAASGRLDVPATLENVIAISAGGAHSLALKEDGTVTGWGDNSEGQINVPEDLRNVVAISAGGNHSLALKSDGTAVGWGNNFYGQSTPPTGLSNVTQIDAGDTHSLALRRDGTVTGWGNNFYEQATPPANLPYVLAIAAGFDHSIALTTSGETVGWGSNGNQQISGAAGATGFSGLGAGAYHSLGLKGFFFPEILRQPSAVTVAQGGSALLSVVASGPGGFTFQWRRNGTIIYETSEPYLILKNLSSSGSGNYTVTVVSPYGQATSSEARVTVGDPGKIPVQIGALGRYHHGATMLSRTDATAMKMDPNGNLLVSGRAGNELFTLKLDNASQVQWVRTYNGPFNLQEEVGALISDPQGNVYVGGSSGSGFLALKYRSDGDRLWAVDSLFSQDLLDPKIVGMAFAPDGNLILAGHAQSGSYRDYVVLKLKPDGELIWITHFRPDQSYYSTAVALALDGSGHIYITGASEFSGSSRDYATIKLDPKGNQLWTATYSAEPESSEFPAALLVDTVGNAYVTGMSQFGSTTVKYSPQGAELWKVHHANTLAPRSLLMDKAGDLYLAGYHEENELIYYTLIKLNANGTTLWEASFNSQIPPDFFPHSPAINQDAEGNIYLSSKLKVGSVATDYLMLKYSPSGQLLWQRTYSPMSNMLPEPLGVEIDASGRSFTLANIGRGDIRDLLGISYSAEGDQRPGLFYNQLTSSSDQAIDLAVDSQGNSFAVGNSFGENTDKDITTVKFDSQGRILWVRRFNGTWDGADEAHSVALDPNGNILVAGTSYNTSDAHDFLILKYNSNGDLIWKVEYSNAPFREDFLRAMAVDGAGNIIVAGYVDTTLTEKEFQMVKWSPSGQRLWVAHRSTPVYKMTVDASGNIYVIGSDGNGFVTTKYDGNGNEQWTKIYNPEPLTDISYNPLLIKTDKFGNIWVCGTKWTFFPQAGAGVTEVVLLRYGQDGSLLSSRLYDRNHNPEMHANPNALEIDSDGNVLILAEGSTIDYSGRSFRMILLKFSPEGPLVWRAEKASWYDRYSNLSLELDNSDNIYLTATVDLGISDDQGHILAMKYSPDGARRWETSYNGPGGGYDSAVALKLDENKNVYVLGSTIGIGSDIDYTLVKLVQDQQPQLQYYSSEDRLWLSWSEAVDDLNLEATTSFKPPVVWEKLTPERSDIDGQNYLFLPTTAPSRFFRLRQGP